MRAGLRIEGSGSSRRTKRMARPGRKEINVCIGHSWEAVTVGRWGGGGGQQGFGWVVPAIVSLETAEDAISGRWRRRKSGQR